ncbi:MAG: biopolymer transporter ExbD [Candidatus Hydrogenedentes bacterium]|nr:biopolymer transporter ExbD [Candidatus Hydrogenedentota bacterium]
MNNAFGRARKPRRPSINITSLIDVMFLLLIFFMVSSVFRDNAGIDITLPSAATATEQLEAPHEIRLDSGGGIEFDGESGISMEALEARLRELLAEEPGARMALSADGGADTKDFVAVIDLARKVGGEQLIIRTQRPDTPMEEPAGAE